MGKLFGTDGIRGLANEYPVTAEVALRVGRAMAYLCREEYSKKGKKSRPRILIGKDTRRSCYMLENALTAGICSMGGDALLLGPIPTPAVAFLIPNMRAKAGVVISASHNPYEDNGIKVFGREGYKIPDEAERKLEDMVLNDTLDKMQPLLGDQVGRAKRIDDVRGRYIVFAKNSFPDELTLSGVKLLLDCANGATYRVAPEVFWELGADVETVGTSPSGRNINDKCGALYPASLAEKVIQSGADAGLAFDGDGDRLIVVDEKGNVLTGDHIMAICAKEMKARGTLKNDTVVATIMSNVGLTVAAKELGINLERTRVGDRFVLETMMRLDATLGGEASGHMIFRNHHTTGDGIIAALQVLSVALSQDKPLSELAKVVTMFPQHMVNVEVRERPEISSVPAIAKAIAEAESELGEQGRVLVRYSGTQPFCRVMAEGPSEDVTVQIVDRIAEVVTQQIGKIPAS
jgi:phosphoglucosamine mutase